METGGNLACRDGAPDPYLERIRERVFQRSRLYFGPRKLSLFRQRLETRLAQLGLADYRSYLGHLEQTPGEYASLLDLMTINETFFFRNPDQFRHLRQAVLPGLELARGREMMRSWGGSGNGAGENVMKLRVLCAGCSTGEEPYTVAMTLMEGLRYPKAWDIEIVAGDISKSCLKAAREGFYETERLHNIPPHLIGKYFTATAGGAFVGEELRELVRFIPLNLNQLMEGELPPELATGWGGFDLVFCRNVMIYFAPSCQQLLVETLSRLLAPGGHLFTGDAEPLHLFSHDLAAVPDAACLVYRKLENVENASAL
ncbi:protein-glutamate O-methyltransferase CheR [Geomonas sp. Red69]|uniref:Protein-glutamate O-methyltransferase CheR n=1 Tax=Geomonas diazotrophica TaxID=2843197 RepID=A0ABX8JDB5_9BACT|nr:MULTISPECIES: protein-glutamate O-methyltransferase CheR [Geomonas]MBU5637834.1 protein-glutamate O-methyltransferase CheR [Geomonas diazotrophica]QWV96365.1 protein-glutamate O-methyltransferase CheR [Geomonas nitrogeniifigens]QXE85432.1 protein-glutamate O-methyltransferase CheR [Geomonas nitrogeniifigens]